MVDLPAWADRFSEGDEIEVAVVYRADDLEDALAFLSAVSGAGGEILSVDRA